jgi:hypothetical protein
VREPEGSEIKKERTEPRAVAAVSDNRNGRLEQERHLVLQTSQDSSPMKRSTKANMATKNTSNWERAQSFARTVTNAKVKHGGNTEEVQSLIGTVSTPAAPAAHEPQVSAGTKMLAEMAAEEQHLERRLALAKSKREKAHALATSAPETKEDSNNNMLHQAASRRLQKDESQHSGRAGEGRKRESLCLSYSLTL